MRSRSILPVLPITLLVAFLLVPVLVLGQSSPAPSPASRTPSDSACTFADRSRPDDSVSLYSAGAMHLGSPDAPIRLLEFFDPNCPYCRRFHKRVLPKLRSQIPADSLSLFLRPFPLSKKSIPQFHALYFADEQESLPRLLDVMFSFSKPSSLSRSTFVYYARAANLPTDSLVQAVSRSQYQGRLRQAVSTARSMDIEGTPTLFINGQRVSRSSLNPQCLSTLIRRELENPS